MPNSEMVSRRTWQEFRDAGLVWWANRILHVFGWAIILQVDNDGEIADVFPARVKFRGFNEEWEAKCHIQLSEWMQENAQALLDEAKQ